MAPDELSVGVIVRTWHRRQFLDGALTSVLTGSSARPPERIVVVHALDDPPYVRALEDRGMISVYSPSEDQGVGLVAGIEACPTEVLAFLDDDDLFLPSKLARLRQLFAADPELGFYRHAVRFFWGDGAPTREVSPPPEYDLGPPHPAGGHLSGSDRRPQRVRGLWYRGAGYNLSSIAMRRRGIVPHLPELRRIRCGCPPFLFLAATVGDLGLRLDSEPLTWMRLHGTNASGIGRRAAVERWAAAARTAPSVVRDTEVLLGLLEARGDPGGMAAPMRSIRAMNRLLAEGPISPRNFGQVFEDLAVALRDTPPMLLARWLPGMIGAWLGGSPASQAG